MTARWWHFNYSGAWSRTINNQEGKKNTTLPVGGSALSWHILRLGLNPIHCTGVSSSARAQWIKSPPVTHSFFPPSVSSLLSITGSLLKDLLFKQRSLYSCRCSGDQASHLPPKLIPVRLQPCMWPVFLTSKCDYVCKRKKQFNLHME